MGAEKSSDLAKDDQNNALEAGSLVLFEDCPCKILGKALEEDTTINQQVPVSRSAAQAFNKGQSSTYESLLLVDDHTRLGSYIVTMNLLRGRWSVF